jgi:hypothetical protein
VIAVKQCAFARLDQKVYTAAVASAQASSFDSAHLPELLLKPTAFRTPEDIKQITQLLRNLCFYSTMDPTRVKRIAASMGVCTCLQYNVMYTAHQLVRMQLVMLEGEVKLGQCIVDDWENNPDVEVIRSGEQIATTARRHGFRKGRNENMGHFAVCTRDCLVLWVSNVRFWTLVVKERRLHATRSFTLVQVALLLSRSMSVATILVVITIVHSLAA